MKISPLSEDLERPTLEEIKERLDAKPVDPIVVVSQFIQIDEQFYDIWCSKKEGKLNK